MKAWRLEGNKKAIQALHSEDIFILCQWHEIKSNLLHSLPEIVAHTLMNTIRKAAADYDTFCVWNGKAFPVDFEETENRKELTAAHIDRQEKGLTFQYHYNAGGLDS